MNRLRAFLELLEPRERRWLGGAAGVAVAAGAVQLAGVGSVYPFIAAVADPAAAERIPLLRWAVRRAGAGGRADLLLVLGTAAAAALLLANAVAALDQWVTARFAERLRVRIATGLLARYLALPYAEFVTRSQAALKRNVIQEADRAATVARSYLALASGVATLLFVAALLLAVEPVATGTMVAVLGGGYAGIYVLMRHRLRLAGERRLQANRARYVILDAALGGFKELKVLGRFGPQLDRFHTAAAETARFDTRLTVLGSLPRYLVELLAFGALLVAVLVMARTGGLRGAVPVLGLFALAAYRMLPAMQRAYSSAVALRMLSPALETLRRELAGPAPAPVRRPAAARLPLRRAIELRSVTFAYPGSRGVVLRDVTAIIPARAFVALVGETGSGKTTLADLILGLLRPSSGSILVDGVPLEGEAVERWQRSVGYVPQDVYLADDTVERNIAFGLPDGEIDREAVRAAARTAQIHEFVESLPEGYATRVGPRGARLSGGQRQRIGIARALYHRPDVLVLDEATSMLDGRTEADLMAAVEALAHRLTLVVIAHRLATIRAADTVLLLDGGRLVDRGTYHELLDRSELLRRMAAAGTDGAARVVRT